MSNYPDNIRDFDNNPKSPFYESVDYSSIEDDIIDSLEIREEYVYNIGDGEVRGDTSNVLDYCFFDAPWFVSDELKENDIDDEDGFEWNEFPKEAREIMIDIFVSNLFNEEN